MQVTNLLRFAAGPFHAAPITFADASGGTPRDAPAISRDIREPAFERPRPLALTQKKPLLAQKKKKIHRNATQKLCVNDISRNAGLAWGSIYRGNSLHAPFLRGVKFHFTQNFCVAVLRIFFFAYFSFLFAQFCFFWRRPEGPGPFKRRIWRLSLDTAGMPRRASPRVPKNPTSAIRKSAPEHAAIETVFYWNPQNPACLSQITL